MPSLAMVISLVYCSGVAWPGMTALFSPSMPMEIAPERLTLAFSSRTTLRLRVLQLGLSAAIGPAVPPPITSTSQETSESPSTISSSAIVCSWFAGTSGAFASDLFRGRSGDSN